MVYFFSSLPTSPPLFLQEYRRVEIKIKVFEIVISLKWHWYHKSAIFWDPCRRNVKKGRVIFLICAENPDHNEATLQTFQTLDCLLVASVIEALQVQKYSNQREAFVFVKMFRLPKEIYRFKAIALKYHPHFSQNQKK